MDFLQLHRDDLAEGLAQAPEAYRQRHARWISGQQGPQGGFMNRRGCEELYYTTFGLRSLSILGALGKEAAAKAAGYLMALTKRKRSPFANAIAAVSWWDAVALCEGATGKFLSREEREALCDRTAGELDVLRRDDGGWAKTRIEGHGSLYHTFLAACAYARMRRALPEISKIKTFMKGLERPEGGFLENRYSKRPGGNGTTAGIALRLILMGETIFGKMAATAGIAKAPRTLRGALTKGLEHHGKFMLTLLSEEGGFQATPQAPFADLLSTYTALFSLSALDLLDRQTARKALRYALALEMKEGGYAGFAMEQAADCEYTFYGLGVERVGIMWELVGA